MIGATNAAAPCAWAPLGPLDRNAAFADGIHPRLHLVAARRALVAMRHLREAGTAESWRRIPTSSRITPITLADWRFVRPRTSSATCDPGAFATPWAALGVGGLRPPPVSRRHCANGGDDKSMSPRSTQLADFEVVQTGVKGWCVEEEGSVASATADGTEAHNTPVGRVHVAAGASGRVAPLADGLGQRRLELA